MVATINSLNPCNTSRHQPRGVLGVIGFRSGTVAEQINPARTPGFLILGPDFPDQVRLRSDVFGKRTQSAGLFFPTRFTGGEVEDD